MKILLAINKTYSRNNRQKFDSGYFNLYIPMLELGHDVLFYDTSSRILSNFKKTVENFEPNLIFCCMTGNKSIAPNEPEISDIKEITEKGNVITFNWFCDDSWRYDNFSKHICKNFSVCSTPELDYIEKYKEDGYENIILGQWHCNDKLFVQSIPLYDIGFCGGMTQSRASFFQKLNKNISCASDLSYEDLIEFYSCCKIIINPTVNDNDPEKKTQMKLRIFESTCSQSLLVTENVKNLEMYYEPKKEIEVFNTPEEAVDIIDFYFKNETSRLKISEMGRQRFLKEHTSRIRLEKILKNINSIC